MSFVPSSQSILGFATKRKVFVSYDHDDRAQVSGFLGLRNLNLGVDFINHALDREIGGQNDEYKRQQIREHYIRPASVTAVLIGVNYWLSKWSGWEIADSVEEGNGLLAIALKGVTEAQLPAEFEKYRRAGLVWFRPWEPTNFNGWIEEAYQGRGLKEKYQSHVLYGGRKTLLGGL